MTCVGSGFVKGATVLHQGTKKIVLDIEYVFEADSSNLFPGKRIVTYLRLGNELVNSSEVTLLSINNPNTTKIVTPIPISICGRLVKHISRYI